MRPNDADRNNPSCSLSGDTKYSTAVAKCEAKGSLHAM